MSKLNPYLLLGRSQEPIAREKGWFKNKGNIIENKNNLSHVGGFTLVDFELNPDNKSVNTFDL